MNFPQILGKIGGAAYIHVRLVVWKIRYAGSHWTNESNALCSVYASRLRKEKFLYHAGNCQTNMLHHEQCWVASFRSSGEPQRREKAWWQNIECQWQGTNSWWQPADCRYVILDSGMQHSIRYCGALDCRHLGIVAQSLICTGWGTSRQCSLWCRRWDRLRLYLHLALDR